MKLQPYDGLTSIDRSGLGPQIAPAWSAPPDPLAEATARAIEIQFLGSSYLALRNIRCVWSGGALTLRGRVATYYLKQVALQIVTEIAGSRATRDQIEVTLPLRLAPTEGNAVAESPDVVT